MASLVDRVKDILLKPRETWPVVAAEPATVQSVYMNWVLLLAAIPAICGFVGLSLIGFGGFGVHFRIPIVTGLVQMVVGYVLSLVMVFVVALIVDALAPTFGGVKNQVQAVKLVAYSMTAYWLAGIFSLIPMLSILGLLVSLYSIWLLYTGMSALMHNPPEKSAAYTAVVVIAAIVVSIVIGAILGLLSPAGMGGFGSMGARGGSGIGGGDGTISIKGPDGAAITIDTQAMEAMGKRMEAAAKKSEAATASGDPQAAGKAAAEMMAAMAGNASATPIASADLKALLPESVGDLARTGIEASSGQAMGFGGSTAKATYANGDRQLELSITDTGGLAGMAAMAGWANVTMDKETDGKVEKVYKDGARTVHEEYRKDGSHGEVTTILANGVIVETQGQRIDIASLKKIAGALDLGRIEAMKRPAK